MFPEYSKKYEAGYRSFFTIWVVIWTVFNIGDFLVKLLQYESISNSTTKVGQWLFNSMGSFIGLTLGILLLFILNSVPDVANKKKVMTNVGLIMVLGVVYFLFPTFVSIFGNSSLSQLNLLNGSHSL